MNHGQVLSAGVRTILLAVLASTTVAVSGCDRISLARGGTPTPTTDPNATATPRPTVDASVERVVTADGALVLPVPPQPMSFPVAGRVLEVAVTEGQEVSTGDVLARVDLLPFDMAVADAQAALACARDALTQVEEGPSASELAAARSELAAAEAALARLESGASIESARLEVERAKNSLWGVQAQRDSVCGAADRGFADQASCDAAQANVQSAEQGVRIAEQSLAAALASQPQDLSAARARVAGARAALAQLLEGPRDELMASLRARVEQARMALESAEAERDRAVLRAPFDGTVTAVHLAEGVRAVPGAPAVTLAKTKPLRFATSNLSERNVRDVREGARATVFLTAYPDSPLDARVRRIAAEAMAAAGGAVVFTVFLDVDADGLPLRAGMTGRVEISIDADT